MAEPESPLAIVHKWWAKSFEFSRDSDDSLLFLMTKTLETIAVAISSDIDIDSITRCIADLDRDRCCALLAESNEFNIHRLLTFGLIESLQVALLELRGKSSGETIQKEPTRMDEVSNMPLSTITENNEPLNDNNEDFEVSNLYQSSLTVNNEPLNDHNDHDYLQPLMEENSNGDKESTLSDQVSNLLPSSLTVNYEPLNDHNEDFQPQITEKSSGDEESTLSDQIPILADPPIVKNEPLDASNEDVQESSDHDAIGEDETASEAEMEVAQSDEGGEAPSPEGVETEVPPKKKRNRKRKGPRYAYSWMDTDHDYCMRMSARQAEKAKSNNAKPIKLNPTELKCPECNFATNVVNGWLRHLRIEHFTTPVLAGLALRCECGNEAQSDAHFRKCEKGNISVVERGGGPLKRLSDLKETPQCCLCSAYPISVGGYYWHLQTYHKSTLKLNGVYVKCACGFRIYSYTRAVLSHNKTCDGRKYSLHSLDEK